jgi:hypothetical protein
MNLCLCGGQNYYSDMPLIKDKQQAVGSEVFVPNERLE